MTTEGLGTVCLLTVAGLYCLTRGVLAFIAVGGSFATLTAPGLVIVGCVLFLVWVSIFGGKKGRTLRVTINPGGAPADAIKHEVAHAEVGRRHGGHIGQSRVYPDGSGYVYVHLPRNAPLEHEVAVSMAGARGEGKNFWTSPHAAGDRANAATAVAHLPPDEQRRVYRKAASICTPGFWYSGSCSAMRQALQRTGHYL